MELRTWQMRKRPTNITLRPMTKDRGTILADLNQTNLSTLIGDLIDDAWRKAVKSGAVQQDQPAD